MCTALLLAAATVVSFCFFHFGNGNTANITVVYILALILVALNTVGYLWGVISALYCVVAVNYFFSYPYFKINFSLAGYPATFLGMLTIALITGTVTTSLKQQQAAVAEREKQLAEADREKLRANLLRAVSHDLRTPLTSIIGSSTSYLENEGELSDAERTELVTNIREDAQWLLNMVENLLTVTRIDDSSHNKVVKTVEVVEEVVSEAIIRLQKRLPQAEIGVDMPENFVLLPMDPTLIEQVLINLMENALIHSGNPSRIHLSICEEENEITFTVRDFGRGIDAERLPSIFDGTQNSKSSSDGYRGMGIGLSICRTIIQAHGGHIYASNHPEGGAQFTFSLPKEEGTDYLSA